jgi:hypothetical protein
MKHYRMRLELAEEPRGMSGAAVRSCRCCGHILSGSGGGADYLCDPCYQKMYTGKLSVLIRRSAINESRPDR